MIGALLLIAVGVACTYSGFYRLFGGLAVGQAKGHTHRCAKCGAVWWHKPPGGPSSTVEGWPTARAAVEAHTCPKCGAEQFEIDHVGPPPVVSAPAMRPAPPAPAAKVAPPARPAGNQPGAAGVESPARETVRHEPAPAPAPAPPKEPAK